MRKYLSPTMAKLLSSPAFQKQLEFTEWVNRLSPLTREAMGINPSPSFEPLFEEEGAGGKQTPAPQRIKPGPETMKIIAAIRHGDSNDAIVRRFRKSAAAVRKVRSRWNRGAYKCDKS